MNLKDQIKIEKIPNHIAIIMDGNGRWAKKQSFARVLGHQNGVESVRQTVEAAGELGVNFLTMFAFSTENWSRPSLEVESLMSLLVSTIDRETENLNKNNVRLSTIGEISALPVIVRKRLQESIAYLSHNTGLNLILALNYSGRWDITYAVKHIATDVKEGKLKSEDIDSCLFETYLNTAIIPDPELLIRTSGELRISNFLLWKLAYTELYFTSVLWPDFRKEHLYEAIIDFQKRKRRFGSVDETPSVAIIAK